MILKMHDFHFESLKILKIKIVAQKRWTINSKYTGH